MAIKNERFRQSDVYINYDFESVMFRYDYGSGKFYRKFAGDSEESEVKHDNELLNDAIRFGDEIDEQVYYEALKI